MKKAAIFDMDGLLFDTERLYQESWIKMAERFGQIPAPGFPGAICGTSGAHALAVIRAHYPDVDAQAFWEGGIAWVAERAAFELPVKPGALEILQFLQGYGVRLAVASSSPREMILQNLRKAEMEPYFDVVLSGQQVEHGKPEPDIFQKAAEMLGFAPKDCYVFEDGINGVRAGIAAGCKTVMIPDLTPPTPDLQRDCAAVCASLLDARERLASGVL